MTKTCSVAEARDQLPGLPRAVEQGDHVEITRRGKPVAVVLSHAEYERLRAAKQPFREVYEAWRATLDPGADDGEDAFRDVRARGP